MRGCLPLPDFHRLYSRAERTIALLDRSRPLNGRAEIGRLVAAWEGGREALPEFRYAPPVDLSGVIRALGAVVDGLAGGDAWGALYAARALELFREARIVEVIGSPSVSERAAERFPLAETCAFERAAVCAAEWAALEPRPESPGVDADDESDPTSLVSEIRKLLGELRLPVRVTASPELSCAAATGDGFIVVRSGVAHPPEAARRIALHEVLGHALPRSRASRQALGLFAVGTAEGADDEEGRALLIEERHGLLDAGRRRELAFRHLLACAARRGADWVEAVRLALRHGAEVREAIPIAARVYRGGGLAREIVYLPARERVRQGLAEDPTLETWLARGPVSVSAARRLSVLGEAPPALPLAFEPQSERNVATTGV